MLSHSKMEKALGPDHPHVAISLSYIAALYAKLKRYQEAEPLAKRALAINERAFGADHVYVADSLGHLAILYRAMGRNEDAESLEQRAVRIRVKTKRDKSIY